MDYRLLKNISWAPPSREAKLIVVTGKKRIGKSYLTEEFLMEYVNGDINNGIKPRKCLIFDVNDEYSHIKSIYLDHLLAFNIHPRCEIRRIRPYINEKGIARLMTPQEKLRCLAIILERFKGGALLVEDVNKTSTHVMPDDIMGPFCANAHSDCDIIMHYQSASRPLPMIWENTSAIRFHYQHDDVMKSKGKLSEHVQIFKMAQTIVNREYFAGDERYYVWIDKDAGKIFGGPSQIPEQKFKDAIMEYITTDGSILAPFMNRIDDQGAKVFTKPQAIQAMQQQLFSRYYGIAA